VYFLNSFDWFSFDYQFRIALSELSVIDDINKGQSFSPNTSRSPDDETCFKIVSSNGTNFTWKAETIFEKKLWVNDLQKALEELGKE
jgi:hypothetical protein